MHGWMDGWMVEEQGAGWGGEGERWVGGGGGGEGRELGGPTQRSRLGGEGGAHSRARTGTQWGREHEHRRAVDTRNARSALQQGDAVPQQVVAGCLQVDEEALGGFLGGHPNNLRQRLDDRHLNGSVGGPCQLLSHDCYRKRPRDRGGAIQVLLVGWVLDTVSQPSAPSFRGRGGGQGYVSVRAT